MTIQTTDARYAALVAQGFTGHINEMLLAWLQDSGATSDQLTDAWAEMLTVQGFTGHRTDTWYNFLGGLGFSGAIPERENDFWENGGILVPVGDAFTNGFTNGFS